MVLRRAVFSGMQRSPKNAEILRNVFAILKRGGLEEAQLEMIGSPYKEMLPVRWAIVLGMEKLCAALGLQHPLDTTGIFSEERLKSESAGMRKKVDELLRLYGRRSKAKEGRHELKTHVSNALEWFCGCGLKIHSESSWVNGRAKKTYEYSVEVQDAYVSAVS